MKRALALLFAVAVVALSLPAPARAGRWVTDEIRWRISGTGGLGGTSIWVRDTTYAHIDGGSTEVDTTGSFSLDNACIMRRGVVAPGVSEVQAPVSTGALNSFANDTTVVGYLVFQSDSTAAPTATLSSCTVFIDGRVGGLGPKTTLARGWVKADSALVNGAAGATLIVGNETFAVPIRTISPYGNVMRFSDLRARVGTSATGILSMTRAFWRYWKCDDE